MDGHPIAVMYSIVWVYLFMFLAGFAESEPWWCVFSQSTADGGEGASRFTPRGSNQRKDGEI